MSKKPLSDATLEREIRSIFSSPNFDLHAETTKSIRIRVTESLGLNDFPSEKRSVFKALLKRIVDEHDDGEDEKEVGEGSHTDDSAIAEPKQVRKKKATKGRQPTKAKGSQKRKADNDNLEAGQQTTAPYNTAVKRLIELGTAMRLGPRLHRNLKAMKTNDERIDALTSRLTDAGATWNGTIPSKKDVADARKKRQRLDDLDGLDVSLIIDEEEKGSSGGRGGAGGRRRRGRAVAEVCYAEEEEDVAEDEDQSDAENEGEEEERRRKRTKTARVNRPRAIRSDDDDDDDDDVNFDQEGSSSEEEEFE